MNINNSVFLSGGVLNGLKDSLIEMVEDLYQGCLEIFLKFANFSDILNSSYGMLPECEIGDNGELIFKSGVVSPLIEVGQSFGAALALIFLLFTMADIYMQEKMSVETFAKPFLQYLATVVLILSSEKLVAFFWNFGVLFEKTMSEQDITAITKNVDVIMSRDASLGLTLGLAIGAVILLVICIIAGAIIRVCAYIANFSRMIEAGVRAVGFPVAMGISVDSSLRQGALRYLKKFLAVALQGGIFVAISFMFTGVSYTVITNSAQELAKIDDNAAEAMSDSLATAFTWDESKQQYVYDLMSKAGDVGEEAATFVLSVEASMGLVGVLSSIITCIIPLLGLALGCIVVLFKSGQICNDIVGA